MGILNGTRAAVAQPTKVTASGFYPGPQVWDGRLNTYAIPSVSRQEAVQVPSVARARNLIAATIGTLPMSSWTNAGEVWNTTLVDQPDPACPRSVTMSWTIDSLIFYGMAYWQVIDLELDGRPKRARWIDPMRVAPVLDASGNLAVAYEVDGRRMPLTGIGSLIVFQGLDEGVLTRAGRTIRTAVELEQAAYRIASEPVPAQIIRNDGMNLDPDTKQGIIDTFRNARRRSSIAYVEGPLTVEAMSFDSAQLQLVEARRHTAQEVARLMGVPAWYLNAETASATYSNVEQERRSLVDFGLRPYISAVEHRLSMTDLTPRGQRIYFDLDDFLRGNAGEQADIAVKLFSAGIIDQDQALDLVDILPSPQQDPNPTPDPNPEAPNA